MHLAIAESTRFMRDALQLVLSQKTGFEKISYIDVLSDLRRMAWSAAPAVLLLDIDFPDEQVWSIVDFVVTHLVATRLILGSSRCTAAIVALVEKCNVHGFVDKSTEPLESLPLALQAAREDRRYFSASYLQAKVRFPEELRYWNRILTPREMRALALIGQSRSDEEISESLGVSRPTAQGYRVALMRKLGVKGTPKLIHFALQHGFSQVPLLR